MNDQLVLEDTVTAAASIDCLGLTFSSNQARREHFLKLLAEKLKEPEFRKQQGFPKGTDDAILAMSDPPYYTACPNPWLVDFIQHFGKPYDPAEPYRREPLAVDVSVGKTDPIYKAHAYHTKVPHLAMVPSILHYTQPGDVILDGFAGSGMTGVAAQWCGSAPAAYRHQLEIECKQQGRATPRWGTRRIILNDLSPAATVIAANYNLPFHAGTFAQAGKHILDKVEKELRWMYETLHTDGKTKGRIEYTVWSEIFSCPVCSGEINFLEEALDDGSKRVREIFTCPHCGKELNKDNLERVLENRLDPADSKPWQRVKLKPSLISYAVGRTRFQKAPDQMDLDVVARIEAMGLPSGAPTTIFPVEQMYHGSRLAPKGFTCVHHMFLPRTLQVLGALWGCVNEVEAAELRNPLRFWLDSHFANLSIQNRYRPEVSFPYNPLTGVYYIPSLISEASPFTAYRNKLERISKAFQDHRPAKGNAVVATSSSSDLRGLPQESIDYVFTDPPFGENIFYADMNFVTEAWYGVWTDTNTEAIVDSVKGKELSQYQHLMQRCFTEYYRVLKPGRWMTVVFSNSKAAVWNAIQVALQQAGFVVAEVSALDKVQGSYRQVTSTTAVKQDLVISAYKPNGGLEQRFAERGATAESAWDFVQTHLRNLSVVKIKDLGEGAKELEFIAERNPRRIYDRLVAWFVRHDAPVPLSSDEFLGGLASRFLVKDGMTFLPEQVAEYEKKRAQFERAPQMELFVSDERSAIDWLMDFLKKRPSTYQELHPEFITQLGAGWKKHEAKPELSDLLEDNFLRYDGAGPVPSQIHSYLSTNHKDLRGLDKDDSRLIDKARDRWYVPDSNRAQDLEKRRDKALLKEFESYVGFAGRRLKEFRLEVLRSGFKSAWAQKDYATIIRVAQKIPDEALQEDEKLLLWYDQALTRSEKL